MGRIVPRIFGVLRRWVLRPVVWGTLAVVVALLLVGYSPWARHRAAREIEGQLEALLQRSVEIGELNWSVVPVSVELEEVVIGGVRPGPETGRARRLYAEIDPWALLRRVIRLPIVEADGVELDLERYADGSDNYLRTGRRRQGPTKQRFIVEVDSLRIRGSRFSYGEERTPFDVEGQGIRSTLVGIDDHRSRGRLTCERARVDLPNALPYYVGLAVQVVLDQRGLEIVDSHIVSEEIFGRVNGRINWLKEERLVELDINGESSAQFAREVGYVNVPVDGRIQLQGRFSWRPKMWTVDGRFSSPEVSYAGRRFHEVEGHVTADKEQVMVLVDRSDFAGGMIKGRVVVDRRVVPRRTEIEVEGEGLDVPELLAASSLPPIRVEGMGRGNVRYGFDGPLYREGDGWGELEISPLVTEGLGVPIAGRIPLVVEGGVVTTEAISLETAGSRATANAKYELENLKGKLFYQVSSTDLGELSLIWPGGSGEDDGGGRRELWLPNRGRGDFWGTLTWSPGDLRSDIYLDLQGARAQGLSAAEVRGTVASSRAGVDRLALEASSPDAALLLTGRIGTGSGASWELGLDAAGWPLEQMAPWVPFLWPVEGPFTGTVVLSGVGGDLYGRAQGSSSALSWQNQELGPALTELSWGPEVLDLNRFRLQVGGGEIQGEGWLFFQDDALDVSLDVSNIRWEELPSQSLRPARLEGVLSGEARLTGTFACPELRFRLGGEEIRVAGVPVPENLEVGGTWSGDTLSLGGGWPSVAYVSGGGRLDREGADLELDMVLQDLAVLARAGGATEVPVAGFGSGSLTLKGSWTDPEDALEMRLLATELDGSYGDHPLTLLEPAVVRVSRRGVFIESLYVAEKGRDGEAFVTGTIGGGDLGAEEGGLNLWVQARVPNAWLTDILPQISAEGTTEILLSVTGSSQTPQITGVGEIQDGRLVFAEFPHSSDHLQGILLFEEQSVILDSLTGQMGGGSVRAQGELALFQENLDLTLAVAGEDLTLRFPEGWIIAGDGDLNLTWNTETQQVRGSVELRRADYLQDVEMGVAGFVEGFFHHERVEVATADGALADTELALSVEIPKNLRIRNNMANLEGSGSLTIRGTMARPLIFGTVEANPGGTLVYAETPYRTERAMVTFANPYRIEPLVDLVASTKIRDYEIRLSLTGTPDRLQASFFSNPPLPEIEVLRLIATGGSSAGSFTGAPGAGGASAERLLFGQAASIISQRVNNLFGLDTFRIEPLIEAGDNVSTARVEVGKRISKRLAVTYSYAPTDSDEQGLQVEWQLFEGVYLVATQNRDGTYGLDIRREQRF